MNLRLVDIVSKSFYRTIYNKLPTDLKEEWKQELNLLDHEIKQIPDKLKIKYINNRLYNLLKSFGYVKRYGYWIKNEINLIDKE